MSQQPKGILRNKVNQEEVAHNAGEHLDRQEVIRNTRLNAQLVSESSKGDEIRAKLAAAKARDDNKEEDKSNGKGDHLKWDEINLYKSEQEKCATMKIDEPKTPYVGGFNPQGEYYKDDESIPDFELGEGEFDIGEAHGQKEEEEVNEDDGALSSGGSEVVEEAQYQQEKETNGETAEERHRRFEELRKQHYHMKGEALKHTIPLDEDDEAENEN